MITASARQLADILGADLLGDKEVNVTGSAETDSRLVTEGSLFFAKPGEQADGHDFVADAKLRGAVVAVVEHRVDVDITQLVVANTVDALGVLAAWLIGELKENGKLKVVGITGSNGKTTTKNMLRAILSQVGNTIAPIESFNNKVGAPISILRADLSTEFLVVEMGAEGLGTIAYLAKMAQPDVGVILKVGMAHAGEFGGIDVTARIKGELAEALGADAWLVLNADDGMVAAMKDRSKASVKWFGTSSESEYWASDISLSKTGTTFSLHWPDGDKSAIQLSILGEHHVMNALAAAAVSHLLGASKQQGVGALEAMELAERWRMQRVVRSDGVTVINDS
jgi:UDP-N-acetylmuramoyl-tripeptide--D-alanyl-D-alanine ligase